MRGGACCGLISILLPCGVALSRNKFLLVDVTVYGEENVVVRLILQNQTGCEASKNNILHVREISTDSTVTTAPFTADKNPLILTRG